MSKKKFVVHFEELKRAGLSPSLQYYELEAVEFSVPPPQQCNCEAYPWAHTHARPKPQVEELPEELGNIGDGFLCECGKTYVASYGQVQKIKRTVDALIRYLRSREGK